MSTAPFRRTQAWGHLSMPDKVELITNELDEFEVKLDAILKESKRSADNSRQFLYALIPGVLAIVATIIAVGHV